MTTARSFESNGQFKMTDLTQDLLLVPNTYGLVNSLGLFREQGVTQNNITIEMREGTLALIGDSLRGSRHTVNSDDTRKLKSLVLPHFNLADYISPEEIQGKRAYGSDGVETIDAVRMRKIERMRRNWDITMEAARCQAIVSGTAYAPNGTVAIDYYTEFDTSRTTVDFVLGTGTTDVIAKNESVISTIQDSILTGTVVDEILVLASPEWFNKYVNQAKVADAYKFYSSTQEPQRNRLGRGLYREFVHAGLRIKEYRGSYNGTRLIPAGEAYAFPLGVDDMFETYFGPCGKFQFLNTVGESAYMFEYNDPKDEQIELYSESNFLNVLRRPQAVVKLISSN